LCPVKPRINRPCLLHGFERALIAALLKIQSGSLCTRIRENCHRSRWSFQTRSYTGNHGSSVVRSSPIVVIRRLIGPVCPWPALPIILGVAIMVIPGVVVEEFHASSTLRGRSIASHLVRDRRPSMPSANSPDGHVEIRFEPRARAWVVVHSKRCTSVSNPVV